MVYLSRRVRFSAAHRYWDPRLKPEENEARFGPCTRLHGHNYELEVTVAGRIDPDTGMVVHLGELDRVIREAVLEKLDHRHLNVDVPEFADTIPTTEMLARWIWRALEPRIPGGRLVRVRLYEEEDLFVDYTGE
jgi:6-pyruvoyltetrahydropterin/6-carboxytetrahydropterin synthase